MPTDFEDFRQLQREAYQKKLEAMKPLDWTVAREVCNGCRLRWKMMPTYYKYLYENHQRWTQSCTMWDDIFHIIPEDIRL